MNRRRFIEPKIDVWGFGEEKDRLKGHQLETIKKKEKKIANIVCIIESVLETTSDLITRRQ